MVSTRILTPAGARFETVPTPVPNTRKLVVRLPKKITDLRLVVALTPHPAARPAPPLDWKDRPLKRW